MKAMLFLYVPLFIFVCFIFLFVCFLVVFFFLMRWSALEMWIANPKFGRDAANIVRIHAAVVCWNWTDWEREDKFKEVRTVAVQKICTQETRFAFRSQRCKKEKSAAASVLLWIVDPSSVWIHNST